jgi:hypothetical protein
MTKTDTCVKQRLDGAEHWTDKLGKADQQDTRVFAERFRLKVIQGDCRDLIIEGRRFHLYFDAGELCLMALDTRIAGMGDAALSALSGKLWTGEVYKDPTAATP